MDIPPVPVEDYIEYLWQSVKEGFITWPELNDLQATFLATQQPIPIPPRFIEEKTRSE